MSTVYELGWSQLENGALITAAEAAFDLLLTTDQNICYQQNLSGRTISILVLPTTSWPVIQRHVADVISAIATMAPGEYRQLTF